MNQRAASLIRKCLAVAASTTHVGERDAALSRAHELCLKYGLDPVQFETPDGLYAPRLSQSDEPAHVYDTEFWQAWETHWRDQKRNQRYGGRSPEELMRDPEWVASMAEAARDHTNSYFEQMDL